VTETGNLSQPGLVNIACRLDQRDAGGSYPNESFRAENWAMLNVIKRSDLPWDSIAHEFVGDDHGGIGFTFLIVDAGPGEGPALHRHPYVEVLIVLEGKGKARVGDQTIEIGRDDIVVIPANVPHAFVCSGPGRLRQVDIHASSHFETVWLEKRGTTDQ
jgi:mannose-6-phosphate isomerase-like protein (cupin superfamily)